MAKYTGPVCKLCRREGMALMLKGQRCLTDKCAIKKKKSVPGLPRKNRRAKFSEYAIQLREKQKIKRNYGLLEAQFRRVFERATRMRGITGDNMLSLLERRPVIAVGGIHRVADIQNAVIDNNLDAVSMCRPLITEPDLVNKFSEGRSTEAKCKKCNNCLMFVSKYPVRCYYGKIPKTE